LPLAGPLLALAVFASAGAPAAELEGPCEPYRFEDLRFTVCRFDLRTHRLRLFWRDEGGLAYGGFHRLPAEVNGEPLVVAMNAGMYRPDLSPAGLYIEDGETLRAANTADGPGNFHLKPNGIFYVQGTEAGVVTTERFLAEAPEVDLATQSGPMLVIEGRIHPRFLPESTSRKRRNGVGVADPHTVVFVITEGAVTFHELARLFRDSLGCDDALFLDGSISSLLAPALHRSDAIAPLGPIVAAFARKPG
jgi:uncharacterized protein YigE (DUF2233 family)